MFGKLRFYVSPYFLIRYYLRRDITFLSQKFGIRGKLLDVGCGEKPYEKLFRSSDYKGIDFRGYSLSKDGSDKKPDYFFTDAYARNFRLPFSDAEFDHAVSFQVLEHHPRPEQMAAEMARVVKKSGMIMLSCPFIWALHEEPNDYQRFTGYRLEQLFKANNCEILAIRKQGSFFSVVAMLIAEQLNYFAACNKLYYSLAAIIYPFFLLFQYISLVLDFFFQPSKIFINYIILAKKV